jgi:hypothetical protein
MPCRWTRNSGALRHIGGSQSDDWNDLIAAETVRALCVRDTDGPIDDGQIEAGVGGLVGIAPQDETEGTMAAQLIAAHSAVMECYRRANRAAYRQQDQPRRLYRGVLSPVPGGNGSEGAIAAP